MNLFQYYAMKTASRLLARVDPWTAVAMDPDQHPTTARGRALDLWAQLVGVDPNGSAKTVQQRIQDRCLDSHIQRKP